MSSYSRQNILLASSTEKVMFFQSPKFLHIVWWAMLGVVTGFSLKIGMNIVSLLNEAF